MKSVFRQRCYMANVYASWLAVAAVVAFTSLRSGVVAGLFTAAVGVGALALYVRAFPRISSLLGYGSVADHGGPVRAGAPRKVTLYTAVGCPFCPLVRARLRALRQRMGFELEEIDVTLRPDLLIAKGIRAVPVVEVEGRTRIGHVTTDDLATFLAGERAA